MPPSCSRKRPSVTGEDARAARGTLPHVPSRDAPPLLNSNSVRALLNFTGARHKIPGERRTAMKGSLMQHVVERRDKLKRFVRQPLLQVVAIMVKRGWFEEAPGMFTDFLAYVQRLLEDSATRAVGALMMLALLEEFSSSNRSVVGLSWEFHNQCQQRFHQEGHLKMLFRLSLSLLGNAVETLRAQPSQQEIDRLLSEGGALSWVATCVEVVNQTLGWDFSDPSASGGVVGLSSLAPSSGRADAIMPGKAWSDVLVQQSTLDLLYALYAVCRFSGNSALSHSCRQCLVDVSAIKGDVFPDENARLAYLDHSLQSVLSLVGTVSEAEYVDVALIILRLVTNFQANSIMRSQRAQMQLETLGAFTCDLMQCSSTSDEASVEEALDHVLESWSTLAVDLQLKEQDPAQRGMLEALAPYTAKILRAYVEKCLRDAVKEVDEWDAADEEHEDKSVLDARLTAVGCIARPHLGDAVALLAQLIHERAEAFRAVLVQGARLEKNQAILALEQLHWLVAIAGRCVADEGEGEVPMVPDAVAKVSAESGARGEPDPVVHLTNKVVETIKVLDACREAGHRHLVSPMLVETMALFLTRLSQTYLLPEVSERYQLSPSLAALFGAAERGGGVESVLSFIVERAMVWLSAWTSEEEVMNATTQLLLSLAARKSVAKMLLANAAWLHFSHSIPRQLTHDAGVRMIPVSSLSLAMQALCASISGVSGGDDDRLASNAFLRDLVRYIPPPLHRRPQPSRNRCPTNLRGTAIAPFHVAAALNPKPETLNPKLPGGGQPGGRADRSAAAAGASGYRPARARSHTPPRCLQERRLLHVCQPLRPCCLLAAACCLLPAASAGARLPCFLPPAACRLPHAGARKPSCLPLTACCLLKPSRPSTSNPKPSPSTPNPCP
jgi:hypothetical protein